MEKTIVLQNSKVLSQQSNLFSIKEKETTNTIQNIFSYVSGIRLFRSKSHRQTDMTLKYSLEYANAYIE